jgi:formylglycine-generating enzyme required for sulfatase activity
LGALVAGVGVGLFIVVLASRRTPNTNPDSNVRTSPTSTAEATNNYSPSNPPPGMVYVPGGDFLMGGGADAYERPAHEASVSPFFIDTYEVTCAEYVKFTSATGRATPSTWRGKTCPSGWERLPVTGVNWDDARAYASWAGKRLPTEAEWEFAARGNDRRKYPWGDEWEAGAANVNSSNGQLAEVGTYRSPSPFGVYDMSGNAWEWTATDFVIYPGGNASLAKKLRPGKVIRGGCYASKTEQATTTYRGVWPPQGEDYNRTGFRCVTDVR